MWRNAPMRVLSSQGDLVDSYDPALKEHGTVCFLACAGCLVAPPSSFRQPVPALVARAGVRPAAPPATDDHRHVDQVLVVLVAEEAGAPRPAGSARAFSARYAAGCSRWALGDGLVVVEVLLAGRPQAQVGWPARVSCPSVRESSA